MIKPVVIQISQSIIDTVHGRMAERRGMTLDEFRAALAVDAKKHWCSCTVVHDVMFHDDKARKTNQHCVNKHHYHCKKCKKLTQVG